jgi:hypothetical protein
LKCQKELEDQADMEGVPSLAERQSLLANDANLQVSHAAIVGEGVLTEKEFWTGRTHKGSYSQRTASAPEGRAGAKVGLSNALVEAVERMDEVMARLGVSKVIYDISEADREQIMVEKPSIRRAYLANVPHSMSERQFWERFLKHEYAKKASRKRELGEGVANIPDEDSKLFSSNPELLPSMAKRMKRMDPSLNISADANSQQPWTAPVSTRIDSSGVKIGRELVNDINRHAQVVLDGIAALKEAQLPDSSLVSHENPQEETRVPDSCVTMDDLRGATSTKHQPLCILDPSQYFSSSNAASHQRAKTSDQQKASILHSLQSINPSDLPLSPISAEVSLKVLLECSRGSGAYLQGSMEDRGGFSAKSPDTLATELLHSLRKESLTVNELCRFYWQNTGYDGEMRQRILGEINKRYQLLIEERKAATGPERIFIRNLIKPLIDMIDSIPNL